MTSLALAIALFLIGPPLVILQRTDAADWSVAYYNMEPTNFVWSIQTRTNLADPTWADEPVETDGSNLVLHVNGRSPLFWQLKGAPVQ